MMSQYARLIYNKNWSLRKMGFMLELVDSKIIVYLGMGETFIVTMDVNEYVKDYSVEKIVQMMNLEVEAFMFKNKMI